MICLNSGPWNKAQPGISSHRPLLHCSLGLWPQDPARAPAQAAWGMGFPKVAKNQTFGLIDSECLKAGNQSQDILQVSAKSGVFCKYAYTCPKAT